MSETLIDLYERSLVGPVWPASILVLLLLGYTIFAVIGLVDLDFDLPDVDADLDVDLDVDTGHLDLDFFQGLGAVSIKATNFGRVPMVIWGGLFTTAFWMVSYGLWHHFDVQRYSPTWIASTLLCIRNIVIAVGITKLTTQPMLSWFEHGPSYNHDDLVGGTCEITTSEATPRSGQAKFRTDAAPMLINVRTDGPHLNKGDEAKIIGFDSRKQTYQVTSLSSESDT